MWTRTYLYGLSDCVSTNTSPKYKRAYTQKVARCKPHQLCQNKTKYFYTSISLEGHHYVI